MKTSVRYTFKGRPPAAFVAVFILLVVNFCAGYALSAWDWVPASDALHSYGIRFRGGQWRYYSPAIGWYVDKLSFGLHFALMAVAAFVVWLYRDRLQKVEAPPPASRPAGRGDWLAMVIATPAACSLVGGAVISILLREAGWTASGGRSALPRDLPGDRRPGVAPAVPAQPTAAGMARDPRPGGGDLAGGAGRRGGAFDRLG